MRKILGYLLSIGGVAGLALTFSEVQQYINIKLPEVITTTILTIISIGVLVLGIFLLMKYPTKKKQKVEEVPIYQGNKVVGYRRQ